MNKLHPILSIRPPLPEPSHPPFSFFATSDEKFEEARRGGGTKNVVRYKLDNDPNSFFADEEERKTSRNRAVSLPYALLDRPEFNRLTSFETVPTAQEQAQLTAQAEKYRGLRDELLAEVTPEKPLTPEKQQLLTSYRSLVAACELSQGLIGNQLGFIEEIPDIFGYGSTCLHDLNNVENIRKIRRSTFTIARDQPFHVALRFAHPTPQQRETSFKMRWGPFILTIRGGRSVLLSMLAQNYYLPGSNLQELAEAESRMETLLDEGRLTDEDTLYIEDREGQIRTLKKEVKDQNIEHTDAAYLPFYRQIETLKAEIAARKKEKQRLTGAAQAELDALKKKYFSFYDVAVNLGESSENFYGDEGILRLSILPQKKGFLTLQLNGAAGVSIKIPDILKTKAYGVLWERTHLVFDSLGGSFDLKYLPLAVASSGEYRIPGLRVPFVISEDETVEARGDWDTLSPGVAVVARTERSADFREDDPRYDFIVKIDSDGKYLPWLYSLHFFISAGDIPTNETVLWSTRAFGVSKTLNPGYPNPNRDNPIRNATLNIDDISDSKRGMGLVVEVNDPNNTIGFPLDGFKNCCADFTMAVWNEETASVSGETDVLINGVIRDAVLMNARVLSDGGVVEEETQTHGPDSFWRLTIGDLWSIADDTEITQDVILDGLTLGEAWKRLLGLRGFKNDWVAFIESGGDKAGPKLPLAGPGEKPRKAPRKGMKLGAALRELLDEFGMSEDFQELRGRIKRGGWCLDVPDGESKAVFSGAADYEGTSAVLAGATREQDWSRFHNIFTVEGGRDRVTNKKLSVTLPLFESLIDPTSPLYWGSPKPAPLIMRPDLDTPEDVEMAAIIAAIRGTKSGNLKVFPTMWLYPLPAIGDRVSVDGQEEMELARISGMSLAGDTEASVVLRPLVPFSL